MILQIIHYLVNRVLARIGKRVVCFWLAVEKSIKIISRGVNERIFQTIDFVRNFAEPQRRSFDKAFKFFRLLGLINYIRAWIKLLTFYKWLQRSDSAFVFVFESYTVNGGCAAVGRESNSDYVSCFRDIPKIRWKAVFAECNLLWIYRRKNIENLRFDPDVKFCEDQMFCLKYMEKTERFIFSSSKVYFTLILHRIIREYPLDVLTIPLIYDII